MFDINCFATNHLKQMLPHAVIMKHQKNKVIFYIALGFLY